MLLHIIYIILFIFHLIQFTREELAGDAEHVMQLVSCDSQFAGQLSALTHEDVLQAVPEALQGLYHTNKGGRTDLSINACMVISGMYYYYNRTHNDHCYLKTS